MKLLTKNRGDRIKIYRLFLRIIIFVSSVDYYNLYRFRDTLIRMK